jgi:AAA+ ATPase superfamily predicted ATPase
MLVEWVKKHGGIYTVADQSAPDVQRRYLAEVLAERFSGFADVDYRDWRSLFSRLAREAAAAGWRGPLVLDELPYLVYSSPELPAVFQRWIDHEAGQLVVVVAGSSQHMMQGLVLDGSAPLFGRAQEILEILPLSPALIGEALKLKSPLQVIENYTAWGGVPRYWELAADIKGSVEDALDRLVLDPLGPLHREPDRLIAEELPPAQEVRGFLDAIGGGAHRLSEIAGRLGRPATSLNRPLQRLQGMGLVGREVPFGEDERSSKRSLYRIVDPFTRLWFKVVAPNRAQLATLSASGRRELLKKYWPQLVGEAWEELCRMLVPTIGPWGPASRWWRGSEPEWDIVARSLDGKKLLLGEAKTRVPSVAGAKAVLAAKAVPLSGEVVRVLFVAEGEGGEGVITGRRLLGL